MTLKQINRVAADSREPSLIKNIQNACCKKQAFCFGTDATQIVLVPKSRNGIPYVFVWLAVSTEPDSIVRYLDEVKALTRMIGGRWVEFNTARKGFIRVAAKLGFERLPNEEGFMTFKIPV
ncbi:MULTISPECIES: hypothetical protein [Pectobacterium]|uniref:hypothetical protein n=1 Tax=Pectobacterium TaxID=122277 RepID=UPI00193E429D|nr:hypothetical protein [Pectobacterium brasiliense]QRN32605.1 hypothetical protein IHJ54_11345 [Pectobacterium brasiliense]GKV98799.1 hypothetical protein PEC301653_18450 [Pectobacterium carotovorum subsp. carotovorum]